MGIVTGIPDGTDLSGNVTSPANAGGVSGFDSDFFQTTHKVIFNILNKSISVSYTQLTLPTTPYV